MTEVLQRNSTHADPKTGFHPDPEETSWEYFEGGESLESTHELVSLQTARDAVVRAGHRLIRDSEAEGADVRRLDVLKPFEIGFRLGFETKGLKFGQDLTVVSQSRPISQQLRGRDVLEFLTLEFRNGGSEEILKDVRIRAIFISTMAGDETHVMGVLTDTARDTAIEISRAKGTTWQDYLRDRFYFPGYDPQAAAIHEIYGGNFRMQEFSVSELKSITTFVESFLPAGDY